MSPVSMRLKVDGSRVQGQDAGMTTFLRASAEPVAYPPSLSARSFGGVRA